MVDNLSGSWFVMRRTDDERLPDRPGPTLADDATSLIIDWYGEHDNHGAARRSHGPHPPARRGVRIPRPSSMNGSMPFR
jgi:hypothetical protein